MSLISRNSGTKELFGNVIKKDGFSVDFLFNKRQQSGHGASFQKLDLTLDDFSLEEVDNTYLAIILDSGRKSVFTAVIGSISNRQVRRCTTSEYYHMAGSTKYCKKLNSMKAVTGIDLVESQIPSLKTSRLGVYEAFTSYILNNLDALFSFYGHETAKDRFTLYQGRQRAPETMANMLTHGTAKYNRKKRSKARKRKKQRKKKKNGKNVNEQQPTNAKKWKADKYLESPRRVPLIVSGAGMFGKDVVLPVNFLQL
ncbi:hypothetical protein BDF20DRAFT_393458 [Mycotypha africana]|uniref:uncharacterized protein n=1 Tax=Mycotypha africana TaxID=64632 RepID=UPI002300A93E|nr:uncharacterized protein BDF20DRAFT_393458 [Mycotypha africana]KAI8984507.1 hypothetical protein BDF20DRAFT_393458 [Mycotypha africana]